jgi:hypothetical protein
MQWLAAVAVWAAQRGLLDWLAWPPARMHNRGATAPALVALAHAWLSPGSYASLVTSTNGGEAPSNGAASGQQSHAAEPRLDPQAPALPEAEAAAPDLDRQLWARLYYALCSPGFGVDRAAAAQLSHRLAALLMAELYAEVGYLGGPEAWTAGVTALRGTLHEDATLLRWVQLQVCSAEAAALAPGQGTLAPPGVGSCEGTSV